MPNIKKSMLLFKIKMSRFIIGNLVLKYYLAFQKAIKMENKILIFEGILSIIHFHCGLKMEPAR